MASKMSDKETEKFIDAFEQRDRLWRTTSLEYCNRNVRLKAAFDMSKQQATCGIQNSTCRMLQVACCFDMLPVAVRHVAGVDGALLYCCRLSVANTRAMITTLSRSRVIF